MKRGGDRKRRPVSDSESCCGKRRNKKDSFNINSGDHVTDIGLVQGENLRQLFVNKLIQPRVVNLCDTGNRKTSAFPHHHSNLCCNFLDKGISGQRICHCSKRNDICHGAYPGEDEIVATSYQYSYIINTSPDLLKEVSPPTTITSHGKTYKFTGFAVVSTISLDHIPPRHVTHGCDDYIISLHSQTLPQFDSKEAIAVMDYLFVQLMELYDWVKKFLKVSSHWLLLLPVFSCHGDDLVSRSCDRILPISDVLSHLLSARSTDLTRIEGTVAKQQLEGCLVAHLSKHPACLRLDRIGRGVVNDNIELYFLHTTWKSDDKTGSRGQSAGQWIDIWLPLSGWELTGLRTDVVQHSLLLPLAIHHIRLSHSLTRLADQLLAGFSNLSLLEMSLTHISYEFQLTLNKDHMIITASNCGPRHAFTSSTNQHQQSWRRGYIGILQALDDVEMSSGNPYKHSNNERLEFLGDAVVEYLVSIHLYHLFPRVSTGNLSMYRKALVRNQYLSMCAKRVHLDKYVLCGHQTAVGEALQRMPANTLEALIGAVYLEKGLEDCQQLLGRLLFWDDEDLYSVWVNYPPNLFQQEHPNGDRHLLESNTILQAFVQLEEAIGVRFTNVRLLARSMTHSVAGYTYLTGGSYQRMEFLGDACLQFVASHFIFHGFPGHNEGHLTVIRSALVNNKLLAEVAKELGLSHYLYSGDHTTPVMTQKLLADLTESLMAALVLDKGLPFASKLFEVCIFSKLAAALKSSNWLDSKTKLQYAVIHTCKLVGIATTPPVLKVIDMEGARHKLRFTVGVFFRGQNIGSGCGKSIVEAERAAADDALNSCQLILPREMK